MRVLVFNSGSSSLKFGLFDLGDNPAICVRGAIAGFGAQAAMEWTHGDEHEQARLAARNHAEAAQAILALLARRKLFAGVTAIGHRIVHGGERFSAPARITDTVLAELESLSTLAPLHNPPALTVIKACRAYDATVPMVAVFDTAYFQTLPDYVHSYAIPREWISATHPIRRYGFHGLAHRYMVERCHAIGGLEHASSRVISLQLGHGCSIAAVRAGQALETSMGFTPLEGLIMATRPGDIDAGAVLHLLESGGVTTSELNEGLNHRAGLLGLSGMSGDMKMLLEREAQGHAGATLAVQAFCHRARKYLGAYLAVLGGADAIVFGGGIGERAAGIRARICGVMEWCGLAMDMQANQAAAGVEARISAAASQTQIYVIPVDEESLIAQDTRSCL